ncbi:hypothetical protein WCD74_01910 [Actinomycetospora sp. OC33-EN08]|uniref:Uncharacterized protein n=1 Tax=Actinomycetospora aurantiaca TaxID=3129233 RepID=A0ABU8MHA1_9PSEU
MNDARPTTPPNTSPGSPEALQQGCDCSVLLQPADPAAGTADSADSADSAFVNPLCPLHGAQPGDRGEHR